MENKEIELISLDADKLRYLYRLRNEYTHSAQIAGTPSGGVFENWLPTIERDGKLLMGYVPIRTIRKQGKHTEISVRNWPDVLVDCVESALADLDKENAT